MKKFPYLFFCSGCSSGAFVGELSIKGRILVAFRWTVYLHRATLSAEGLRPAKPISARQLLVSELSDMTLTLQFEGESPPSNAAGTQPLA